MSHQITSGHIRSLRDKDAKKLLKKKGIKTGLTWCKIREMLDIQKCYRCWGFEERARECKEKYIRKYCIKYGKEGLQKKDCKEEEYCPLCQEGGYMTTKGRCKIFWRALRNARNDFERDRPLSRRSSIASTKTTWLQSDLKERGKPLHYRRDMYIARKNGTFCPKLAGSNGHGKP